MKRHEFLNISESLYRLINVENVKGKVAEKISIIVSWYNAEIDRANNFHNELTQMYKKEVEQEEKDPVTGEKTIVKKDIIDPEKVEEFKNRIEAFGDEELDINFPEIKKELLENSIGLKPVDYFNMSFFIK